MNNSASAKTLSAIWERDRRWNPKPGATGNQAVAAGDRRFLLAEIDRLVLKIDELKERLEAQVTP